jgi:hypothetical protein
MVFRKGRKISARHHITHGNVPKIAKSFKYLESFFSPQEQHNARSIHLLFHYHIYTESTKKDAGISGICSLGAKIDLRVFAVFYSSTEKTSFFFHTS